MRNIYIFVLSAICFLGCFSGCVSTEEAQDSVPSTATEKPASQIASTKANEQVQSVQLFAGGDQRALPAVEMNSVESLTLAFDWMDDQARPFTVYFYHLDRNGKRDLQPIDYMSRLQADEIYDYKRSSLTNVPYFHYRYTFPNDKIQFRLSGNYLIRVCEQGQENRVLFEQQFWLYENLVEPKVRMERFLTGQGSFPSFGPTTTVHISPQLSRDPFEFTVCFMPNKRVEQMRCSDRPYIGAMPDVEYRLDRSNAFPLETDWRMLDMRWLNTNRQIEVVDKSTRPFEVKLFSQSQHIERFNQSEELVSKSFFEAQDRDVRQSDIMGQYAKVLFTFAPTSAKPYAAPIYLLGSFNNWQKTPESEMKWQEEKGVYTALATLKQGKYEYRFASSNAQIDASFQNAGLNVVNTMNTFVYYRDRYYNTDRLVGINVNTPMAY
jgi:hypothetical protein